MSENVTQEELARVYGDLYDRLQGMGLVFRVLTFHLHENRVLDAEELRGSLLAIADAAEQAQTPETGHPARALAKWCETLGNPPKPDAPDWLVGVIDGGKSDDDS